MFSYFRLVNNPTFVEGRYNGSRAIHFSQYGSWANLPVINILNKNFTITCWIYATSYRSQHSQCIYGDWSPNWQFTFYLHSDSNKICFQRHSKAGGDDEWMNVEGDVTLLNQWLHVAITWDQDQGLARLYIDAVEAGSLSFRPQEKFYPPTGKAYHVGSDTQGNQFYGSMMDLYVLDQALTPQQINDLRGTPFFILMFLVKHPIVQTSYSFLCNKPSCHVSKVSFKVTYEIV